MYEVQILPALLKITFLVSLDVRAFKVERMNMAYNGVEIFKKLMKNLTKTFYPEGSLSLLVDEPDLRHIYNFYQSFEKV